MFALALEKVFPSPPPPPAPRVCQWATPGLMAKDLDRTTIQTPALDLIDAALVDVAEGRTQRLILSVAPQEGKSQRVSRRFPTWCLHRDPDLRIAIASYEFGTARRWGKAIRNDITTHTRKLDLAVEQGSSAANEWTIDGRQGGVYSVGIGGALTGRAVDLLLIDDPIKDREQADSQTYRDRVWEWWTDVALTRLAPNAPVVLILTRWHHDDLAGRLVAAEDGHEWRVINIPAQADHRPEQGETDPLGRQPGEYLQSTRGRTTSDWEAKKIAVGSRTWTALYQGRPTPDTGDVFHRDWWRTYDTPLWVEQPDGSMHVPGGGTLIASWDMAFKDTKGSDYVVGQVWLRRGANAYLLDQVRDRLSFTATVPAVEQLAAKWPQAHAKLVEDKANGTAVLDTLRKKVPGLIPITPTESKYARANAVAPFVQAGNIHLPSPHLAPWVGDLMGECAGFPKSTHDDQVDALSQALARLYLGSGALDYLDRAASVCPACSLPNVLGAITCFQCGADLPPTQPISRPTEAPDTAGQQPIPGRTFGLILPDTITTE